MPKLQVFHLPQLTQTLSNAAGILPLSALIDFSDTVTGLHLYELTSFHSIWNWAITPRGAHALLEEEANSMIKPCYLDRVGKDPVVVTCIDGKWGDLYPCISSHTIRMCAASAQLVQMEESHKTEDIRSSWRSQRDRPVRLTVIRVELINNPSGNVNDLEEGKSTEKEGVIEHSWLQPGMEDAITQINDLEITVANDSEPKGQPKRPVVLETTKSATEGFSSKSIPSRFPELIVNQYKYSPWAFIIISHVGWLLWTGLTAVSIMTQSWYASAWMISVVLSGLTIRYTHGHTPRKLFEDFEHDIFNGGDPRLVLTTDTNVHGIEWTAYIGGHELLDSLLKRPFTKSSRIEGHLEKKIGHFFLQFFILAQWVFIAIACGRADWNALFITFWLAICSLKSTFLYTPHHVIRDWLYLNKIKLSRCEVEMRSQRTMLGVVVALNPDTWNIDRTKNTKWISQILSPSKDRDQWETALYKCLEGHSGIKGNEDFRSKAWGGFIEEAGETAKLIEEALNLKKGTQ